MNTEPPEGDDLHRMLVSMKQNVLERATPRPKRRRHRTGIAIGVVGVLLLGAAGGSVALGLIPTRLAAAPAPSATHSQEPAVTETPSGDPVIDRPTPTATPTPTGTPTPTRPAYALDDPSTWTVSGTEVGPIALGGNREAEIDDLAGPFSTLGPEQTCPNPNAVFLHDEQGTNLVVVGTDGTVQSVDIGFSMPLGQTQVAGPTTPEGLGIGSTLEQLRAAYPDLHFSRAGADGPTVDNPYGGYVTAMNGATVTFLIPVGQDRVASMWVSVTDPNPPDEYC
ncbi:hypothetical protein [Curtobacterium sp. ISL-83]|uniref:hypothetical protein n=1 Tax=Curtobacterium sp. ISL-83 TaxID=2819145 RepID=UPI001BE8331D|nr:hypothetical protein [Curtobacterium sp. ISL-83]MBT2501753.1 hypothetical protein [Curtobacterium sp. ISL-83]